jgi:hypothetical protein
MWSNMERDLNTLSRRINRVNSIADFFTYLPKSIARKIYTAKIFAQKILFQKKPDP